MAAVPSLTKEEKARFLQALRQDSAFREEVRGLLLDEMQTALQNLQASIQNLVALRERDAVLMREGFEAVRQVIQELSRQVQENSRQIARLTAEIQKRGERLEDLSDIMAEAGAYQEISIWLESRRAEIARKYLPGDLQDHLGVSSVPDGLMLLKSDSSYLFLVYEITFTPALRDVRRIAEWLGGFRKVAWPAVGLVHFRRALPEEDVVHDIVENGREVRHTIPGMQTLREEATQSGVLLMQHGASPWRPEGWRPPEGLEEIPELLAETLFG